MGWQGSSSVEELCTVGHCLEVLKGKYALNWFSSLRYHLGNHIKKRFES